ncbi:DUF3891 family protein [Virgibacillus ainsalahensis]
MIVRERTNEFVMIEQDHHAQVSGKIMAKWKDALFQGTEQRKSVEYAIHMHDYGWKNFDRKPFWNDKHQSPYSFNDFPDIPKVILYKHGVDVVEKEDSYAGLLCSEHYKQFLINEPGDEIQVFVKQEEEREERIIESLGQFNKRLFNFHYGLVLLGDGLSLYACLNEPLASEENVHPFFKKGIPLSSDLELGDTMQPRWVDEHTIALDPFPFEEPIDIKIKQKIVAKEAISAQGLIDSYEQAPFEEVSIRLIAEEN